MTARAPRRPARLGDIAREAGVHVSTVSRVLNGSGTVAVRPETRTRILDAARRLRYRPNAMARGLRLQTTGTLGLLVPSLRNPVNSPIVRGAFARAWERNFVLVLAEDTGDDRSAEEAYQRLVEEGRIDGLLIQSARLGNRQMETFASGLVPCVFLDRCHPGSGRNVFMRDDEAGRLVAEHFVELGHTRLAHLAGPPELDTVARRHKGFVERARECDIEVSVESAGLDEETGHQAMAVLLDRVPAPTAVFVANINQAFGALAAVRERGLRVPLDLSLVCHDDDPLFGFIEPALSAVSMPLAELGRTAVDMLLAQIVGDPPVDLEVATPPALVSRGSTGRAPR